MIRDPGNSLWAPGEHTRYLPCARHAGPLSRIDFDRAVDIAAECAHCLVEFRPRGGAG
jgi:hypothetical protein